MGVGGVRIIFFLFLHENIHCGHSLEVPFLHENIYCGHSLEAPWKGASNECPQCMFSWRNKKKISVLFD